GDGHVHLAAGLPRRRPHRPGTGDRNHGPARDRRRPARPRGGPRLRRRSPPRAAIGDGWAAGPVHRGGREPGQRTAGDVALGRGLWGAVLCRGVNNAAHEVAAEVKPTGASVIVGRVTDGKTPLGGVAVAAKGKEGEASTTTLASGDVGAFTLSGLGAPDTYLVTVTMEGFATQTALVPVAADG